MKILYVEDNAEDAELVQRRLRKHSPEFALDVVASQREAITRLSAPDARSIDLVLTDLRLPDGDVISLLTHIRTRGLTVAVVVITGAGDERTAATVLKAGADDYVSKRYDYLERLPLTLENALRRHARPNGPARTFNVLYAERHYADIELTRRHFKEHAPYILLDVVRTGAEALRRLTDAGGTYDVILLDYRLPDLDALEILRQLRQNDAFDTPVVLITGQGGEEAVLSAFRLGAAGYLVKNFGHLHRLPGELERAFYHAQIIREQAALKQSEERLRRAQGAARVGTWDWNLETGESYWSDGIYELLGLDHGDGGANVQDFVRFIHPEDRQRVTDNVESAIKNGEDYYSEFRVIRGDGSIAWLSSKGRLIRSTSGRAERMIGVNIDITERKQTELALRESEERFRSAFDHATIGMALVARDGRFLQVNPSVCKLLGYSEQELLATDFQSLTHPQDLDANLACRRQVLAGETDAFQIEKRYIHKSGRRVWGLLSVSLLRDSDGQPLYFVSQIQDITQRKRAELRLNIQYAISSILSEAPSVADSALRLLQAICEPLDCEFGEIWVPDREAGHLTLLECWSQPSSELVEFGSASRRFTFNPDSGFPGRIWNSGRPDWITDLANNSNFLRGPLARKAGLTSGFGFPVRAGDKTVAVMVFFSREIRERDEDLLEMAGSIADQVGHFAERKQAEDALRLSEDKFSRAFRSSPDAFAISRQADGLLLEVNERWMGILGYAHDEAVGRTVSDLQIYVDFGDRTKLVSLVREQGSARDVEMDLRRKSGEICNISVSAEPIMIRDEACLLLIMRDITHRKQMERALRQEQRRYSLAAAAGRTGVWDWNLETNDIYVDLELKALLGYRDDEIRNHLDDWASRVHPEDREAVRAATQNYIEGRASAFEVEHRMIRKDGAVCWFLARGALFVGEDAVRHIIGTDTDITDRKLTEEALRRSEEALRDSHTRIEDLAGRLIAAQEEERKHLARELHDDLMQQVAALAIGISRLKREFPDVPAVQEQSATLQIKTEWLSERIRKVSHELHSTVLQHVGLQAALHSYCAEFSDQEGIAVSIDIRGDIDAVPPDAALCLYRVAQESLRNIARHSGARSAVVKLSRVHDTVELGVIDQGVGFDPGQAREGRGLGLVSMTERVKLLHGSLVLTARPGAGTELRAQIPLRVAHEQTKGTVG